MVEVCGIDRFGGLGLIGEDNLQTRLAKCCDTPARDLRVGILDSDHDPGNAGGKHRIDTGWGPTMMGAGLQADVEIRSASRVACRSQSYDFCVITPGT
jgi:hypothetical protein